MMSMLNDPEIDKLIIYALAGICAVLFIAVIFLAVKKNTYYIDEDGEEIIPKNARVKKVSTNKKKKPVIVEEYDKEEDDEDEEDIPAPAPAPVPVPAAEETLVQPLRELHEVNAREPEPQPERVEETPVDADPVGMVVTVKVAGNVAEHTIDVFPCLVGREAASCNLTISEPAVSRRHARFVKDGNELSIEDVSEHNGTYVNGKKLAPLGSSKLNEGDRINLGRAEIRVIKFIY